MKAIQSVGQWLRSGTMAADDTDEPGICWDAGSPAVRWA
jgi:hypothetical protein